jgi:hypothetical protein
LAAARLPGFDAFGKGFRIQETGHRIALKPRRRKRVVGAGKKFTMKNMKRMMTRRQKPAVGEKAQIAIKKAGYFSPAFGDVLILRREPPSRSSPC